MEQTKITYYGMQVATDSNCSPVYSSSVFIPGIMFSDSEKAALKMIQNDTTYVVTIDISDLQADLPLFGACTGNARPQEENMVTLVDPNTLTPPEEEKQITTEQVFLDQEVVYIQEQVEVQEVPQNEVVIETVDDSLHSSQDQVVEIELAQPEEEINGEDESTRTEGMSLMSDDLASLISEDLDDDLEKAAKDAFCQNSLGPILKEELKTIIQHRRVQGGKEELKLEETRKRPAPPIEEVNIHDTRVLLHLIKIKFETQKYKVTVLFDQAVLGIVTWHLLSIYK